MPQHTVTDAVTTYAVGGAVASGSLVGDFSSSDLLFICSCTALSTRFIYDSVRFYFFMKDRTDESSDKEED